MKVKSSDIKEKLSKNLQINIIHNSLGALLKDFQVEKVSLIYSSEFESKLKLEIY